MTLTPRRFAVKLATVAFLLLAVIGKDDNFGCDNDSWTQAGETAVAGPPCMACW